MQDALSTLAYLVASPGERVNPLSEQDEADSSSIAVQFSELVEQHSRLLYRIALSVTRNHQDAEDAVQETFMQLYRTRQWQQIDDYRAYLARMAWRIALRRRKSSSSAAQQRFPTAILSAEPNPEDTAIDQQRRMQLHALIDQLPEKLRLPLALSGLGELSQVEIAKILSLPEGTVRRRIHTARQKLREQWQQGDKA